MRCFIVAGTFLLALNAVTARAEVTVYTSKPDWQAAALSSTFIGFTGFATDTIITNQYADFGVHFTDGNDFIGNGPGWSDGSGLYSTDFVSPYGGRIHLAFDADLNAVAFDFHGSILVEFYRHGQLIHASAMYSAAFTPFVGFFVSDAFDAAIVYDGDDEVVAIDNLYFGPAVPAPATIALLAIAGLTSRRRQSSTGG